MKNQHRERDSALITLSEFCRLSRHALAVTADFGYRPAIQRMFAYGGRKVVIRLSAKVDVQGIRFRTWVYAPARLPHSSHLIVG